MLYTDCKMIVIKNKGRRSVVFTKIKDRVFANGSGDRVQSQVESYQRLKKWHLIPPCLTLSIIR